MTSVRWGLFRWRGAAKLMMILLILCLLYGWVDRIGKAPYLPHLRSTLSYGLWGSSRFPCGFTKSPFVQLLDDTAVMVIWETNCNFDEIQFTYARRKGETFSAYRSFHRSRAGEDEHRLGTPNMEILEVNSKDQHQCFVHRVHLKDLQGDTLYEYRVSLVPEEIPVDGRLRGRITAQLTPFAADFYLPGERSTNLTIAIIGDNHRGAITFERLLKEALSHGPLDLFMHLGDMVNRAGSAYDWQVTFLEPLQRQLPSHARAPLVAFVMGNHDIRLNTQSLPDYVAPLERLPGSPSRYYYALSLGPARFIILDCSLGGQLGEEQLRWLDSELAAPLTQRSPFRILALHCPPHVEFWDRNSWQVEEEQRVNRLRTHIVPLLERYHVDLVLAGHEHCYQRGLRNGVHYLISGGGGGQLEEREDRVFDHHLYKVTRFEHHYLLLKVSSTEISIQARDKNDRIIDSMAIPKNVMYRAKAKPSARERGAFLP